MAVADPVDGGGDAGRRGGLAGAVPGRAVRRARARPARRHAQGTPRFFQEQRFKNYFKNL